MMVKGWNSCDFCSDNDLYCDMCEKGPQPEEKSPAEVAAADLAEKLAVKAFAANRKIDLLNTQYNDLVFLGAEQQQLKKIENELNTVRGEKYAYFSTFNMLGLPKKEWYYLMKKAETAYNCKHDQTETMPIQGTDETITVCHECGNEL